VPFDDVVSVQDGIAAGRGGDAAADEIDVLGVELDPEVAGADMDDIQLDFPAAELVGDGGPDLGEEVDGELGGGDGDRGAQSTTAVGDASLPRPEQLPASSLPSSLVLQRMDGLTWETICQLNVGVDQPDLAVILNADPPTIAARLAAQGRHSRFERLPDSSRTESDLYHTAAAGRSGLASTHARRRHHPAAATWSGGGMLRLHGP
jgi:hypothetical protein